MLDQSEAAHMNDGIKPRTQCQPLKQTDSVWTKTFRNDDAHNCLASWLGFISQKVPDDDESNTESNQG